jgi:hypothetical protein
MKGKSKREKAVEETHLAKSGGFIFVYRSPLENLEVATC